jgi:hypothetical protein
MNRDYLHQQILLKKSFYPYQPDAGIIRDCVTDMDHFPYTRFYRGEYQSDKPVIYGREAGYHPVRPIRRRDEIVLSQEPEWDIFFQNPCSTLLPKKGVEKPTECVVWSSP